MMASKKKTHAHPDQLILYEKLVDGFPGVQIKGDAIRYTSLNGNMYSFLSKDGEMAMRLPEKEREAFIKKYKTKLHEAYGAVLKEYVTVPENVLANTKEMKKYFGISYEYVQSLRPKPTTKKKK